YPIHTLCSSSFSLHGPPHPPALHSFPTRRSSDLFSGPPGTSLAVMRSYGEGISRELLATPGVQTVEQQIGRSEGGEDPWGSEKRSEEHTSELQSLRHLVCRLLLEKKKKKASMKQA